MKSAIPRFARCILIGLAFVLFLSLCPWLVQWLWNGVLVKVVSVKVISYWQAFGLLLLAKILFGGFPGGGGRRCGPRCGGGDDEGGHGHGHGWGWCGNDPEKRERMRDEMRRRFGDWPRPTGAQEDADHPGEADVGRKPEA